MSRAFPRGGVVVSSSDAFAVVRYRRVSTDNKGQDPKRQFIATDDWARREGLQIVGDIEDEGTSATFTLAMDRPKFLEACALAKRLGARGVLAESVDRVCGQGSEELGWTRFETRRRFGLEIFFADVPLVLHGSLAGNVTATTSADVRRDRVALDRRRMKEGIAGRAAKGLPIGGQTQAKLRPDLLQLVAQIRGEEPGWGCRRIAREASRRRGADVASLTTSERRERTVTHETVRKALRLLEPSNGGLRQSEGSDVASERGSTGGPSD